MPKQIEMDILFLILAEADEIIERKKIENEISSLGYNFIEYKMTISKLFQRNYIRNKSKIINGKSYPGYQATRHATELIESHEKSSVYKNSEVHKIRNFKEQIK